MSDMFFDMEQVEVATRIRKFRDEKSHPKNRLKEAAVLVDLVDRMVNASVELEAEIDDETNQDAVQPEDFEPAVDGGNPVVVNEGGIVDSVKKLFS